MSQDNKKPVVYRSQKKSVHVPSENSNYIDLCETRRRSKTSSPTTEPIVEKRIILEDPRDASICERKMKTTLVTGIGESQGSSSFQLSQVSKEVEKLKEMMESWSKGKDSVGQSQSIARDLLRGALDIQESLVMLGKLQEASNFMADLKKKSRPKFEVDAGKDTNAESVGFSRHGRYAKKMENPRTSVYGSKNSVQDLKNVIRESLSRPNLQVSEESSFREDVNAQNLGLDRFRNYSYRQRPDDPRISVDRFSGNRREELKNMIRDSLSKQNLISALSPPDEVKPFSTQKQPICLPDVCSSSSSRSYSAPSDGGCQNLSEINVLHQPKKANSPNLIAKLMGLETLPSDAAETKKSASRTKKSSQWTPVINIEMPKVKKLQIVDDNGDPGRKALKEILDSMQFKGLLKSNHSGDLKFHSDFLGGKTQKLNTEKPPIVIIKPLHSSGYGKDEMSGYGKDEMSDYGKDEMSDYGKDEVSDYGKDEMSGYGKDEMSGYEKDEIYTYKKDEIRRYKKDGVCSYKKDELQTDELVKQYRASDPIPLQTEVAKEDSETKQNNEKASGTGRASVSYISRSYKKEANKLPKKSEKMAKGVPDGRNSSHKENTKSIRTLKSQQKTIPCKTRKIEASPLQQKNLATTQVITLQQHKPRRSTKSVQLSTNQTRKTKMQIAKAVKKSSAVELDIENNKESQDDDNKTDSSSPANDLSVSTSTLPTDEASMETRQEEVEILIRDHNHRECEPKTLSEDMPEVDLAVDLADDLAVDLAANLADDLVANLADDLAANLADDLAADPAEGCQPTEETEQLVGDRIPSSKSSNDELKFLLLSSPSFISRAEEMFHFHLDQPLVCHTSKVDELGNINTSLLLDCADELMDKSRQRTIASHQNKTHLLCQVRLTLNRLVEEIVDGIEDLSYSKIGDHSFGTENLYLMLERDLLCSSMVVNGVWDLGWLNGLNLEETEQIVGEVEKHVVEALIHEAVMELASY